MLLARNTGNCDAVVTACIGLNTNGTAAAGVLIYSINLFKEVKINIYRVVESLRFCGLVEERDAVNVKIAGSIPASTEFM